MTALKDMLDVAVAAVAHASELMRTRAPGTLTGKGDRDYASEVDFAIERELRAMLADVDPSIGFLGEEEGGASDGYGDLWTLDPVDGTVNFAHRLPLCAVSLALLRDRRPVLGVIELPFLDSRYTAIQGGGAYANDRRIRVSGAAQLSEAVVAIGDYAVGVNADRRNEPRLGITRELAQRALRVRMFGSAAIDLAWMAEGKTDAAIMLSNRPWDVAAGVIIAREAGALVVDSDGSPHRFESGATIAAPPALLPEVLSVVQAAVAVTP